jgi:hypothetical protein
MSHRRKEEHGKKIKERNFGKKKRHGEAWLLRESHKKW